MCVCACVCIVCVVCVSVFVCVCVCVGMGDVPVMRVCVCGELCIPCDMWRGMTVMWYMETLGGGIFEVWWSCDNW